MTSVFSWQNSKPFSCFILYSKAKRTLHMDITKWSISKSDWLYSLQPKMEKLYTVSNNNNKKKQELTVAQVISFFIDKFRLKLTREEKTIRPSIMT